MELDRDLDDAIAHVLAGFAHLSVHPDVPAGIRALRAGGHRLVTLSNGAAEVAQGLLQRAGLRDEVEALLSVEDAGVWKPHPDAYAYAARTCRTEPANMMLVAVHPWDIDGAARAGLATAWINRTSTPYPRYCQPPDHTVTGLDQLAAAPSELSTQLPCHSPHIAGTVDCRTAIGTNTGSRILRRRRSWCRGLVGTARSSGGTG